MEHRKIQLVAGTTYTISLPKSWIHKNRLEEGKSLAVMEQENGSLLVSKDELSNAHRERISLNTDEYSGNIDNILMKLYYLGFENIEFFSKNMTKDIKKKIRGALSFLIGAEIIHEEQNKIIVRVLLDKSKVDFTQSLFRMSLIVEHMIDNVLEEIDYEEMTLNENETDRLYHLITKMLSLSITDASILSSSKIENVNFITHYMLMAKRLEIIADNIYQLAKYLVQSRKRLELEHKRKVADFLRHELNRSLKHIRADYVTLFFLPPETEIKKIQGYIEMIKDGKIKEHLNYPVKLLLDNEEDIISISFSKKLMREKIL